MTLLNVETDISLLFLIYHQEREYIQQHIYTLIISFLNNIAQSRLVRKAIFIIDNEIVLSEKSNSHKTLHLPRLSDIKERAILDSFLESLSVSGATSERTEITEDRGRHITGIIAH